MIKAISKISENNYNNNGNALDDNRFDTKNNDYGKTNSNNKTNHGLKTTADTTNNKTSLETLFAKKIYKDLFQNVAKSFNNIFNKFTEVYNIIIIG
jgi:hypothetical protein